MSKRNKKPSPTLSWNNFEEYLLTEGLDKFREALEEADPTTYLKIYPTLLEFIRPKLKRLEGSKPEDTIQRIVVQWDEAPTGSQPPLRIIDKK